MKNFVIAIIITLFTTFAFADEQCGQPQTAAEKSSVELLIQKLNERDLTIKELSEENMELMVDNIKLKEIRDALANRVITLKQANVKLRESLAKTSSMLDATKKAVVTYSDGAVKATKAAYTKTTASAKQTKEDSVKAAITAVRALEKYLETVK